MAISYLTLGIVSNACFVFNMRTTPLDFSLFAVIIAEYGTKDKVLRSAIVGVHVASRMTFMFFVCFDSVYDLLTFTSIF